MPEIQHRVGIHAPIERVHARLATMDGLADFWTTKVAGDPGPGGELRFTFAGDDPAAVMQVTEVTPDRVAWHCSTGPPEWVGTDLTFNFTSLDNETAVYFIHAGWRETGEFMGHCTTKWGYFLLGLKSTLEGAEPVSFPNDRAISGWEE